MGEIVEGSNSSFDFTPIFGNSSIIKHPKHDSKIDNY